MSAYKSLPKACRWYVLAVITAGTLVAAHSLHALVGVPPSFEWFLLAALTLLSGSFTIRIPSASVTISVSETFVITAVLLYGTAAGTIIVILDGMIISLWLAKNVRDVHKVLFNAAAPALSIWSASELFFLISGTQPLSRDPAPVAQFLAPLFLFTLVYYLLNSWFIAVAIGLEKSLRPFRVWRENLLWLSLNYFGGASVAALLVAYTQTTSLASAVAIIVPILVITYLTFKTSIGRVEDANRHLTELNSLYVSTIETLAMAIDAKDQVTHGHIRRVQLYAVGLARKVGVKDEAQVKAIEAAALLHDMGKLAVPEYILNKPGKLTPREFEKMKLHAGVGAQILSSIDFPYPVVPIVRHHHEHWDGSGYPDGLRGTDIPLGARILSVVDCFDALTSDRPYRPKLDDSEAIRILLEHQGTTYDPLILDAFLKVHSEIATSVQKIVCDPVELDAIRTSSSIQADTPATKSSVEDLSATNEEMLALYDLARALSGSLGLADTADTIWKHLQRIIPASICTFYVYEPKHDDLRAVHVCGEGGAPLVGLRIPLGERLTGWVAANRQTVLNSNPFLDHGEVTGTLNPRPLSCLSSPILAGDQLVGVLTLYSPASEAFTQDHGRIVQTVARQVARPIAEAVRFETTKTSALQDSLTGLPNMERLQQLFVSEAGSQGLVAAPLSLLLIDVDDLGSINASFGREAGDHVLGTIAKIACRALRGGDILFRSNNDELVALLTQTDQTTSRSVADRVFKAISASAVSLGESTVKGAASVGSATFPDNGTSLNDLLAIARLDLARNRESMASTF